MKYFDLKRDVWYKITKAADPKWIGKNLMMTIHSEGAHSSIHIIVCDVGDWVEPNRVSSFLTDDTANRWFTCNELEVEIDKQVGENHIRECFSKISELKEQYELDNVSISVNDNEYRFVINPNK